MELIADTSFLIGLWRRQKWALELADRVQDRKLYMPWVVEGEFRHGSLRADHPQELVDGFLGNTFSMMCSPEIIRAYAKICVHLQQKDVYHKVSQNDIWIGACVFESDGELLTRNQRHFREMPGVTFFEK